jgi:hypothetical protein
MARRLLASWSPSPVNCVTSHQSIEKEASVFSGGDMGGRMVGRTGMILSQLDKVHLQRILALFINNTGVPKKDGAFRYSAEDIKRQMSFGGDFSYTFGDFFKLVFVRHGIRRSERDPDAYDTIIFLDVQLDNVGTLRKDDKLYVTRARIADETTSKIEKYIRENDLAVSVK